jgi:hypothetical protein
MRGGLDEVAPPLAGLAEPAPGAGMSVFLPPSSGALQAIIQIVTVHPSALCETMTLLLIFFLGDAPSPRRHKNKQTGQSGLVQQWILPGKRP